MTYVLPGYGLRSILFSWKRGNQLPYLERENVRCVFEDQRSHQMAKRSW
jgi:hypothetical protein